MPPLRESVIEILTGLNSAFAADELAYLALTQKVEWAVRDKLAFGLHSRLCTDPDMLVCREWNRFDLAVLKNDIPIFLLEAKAIYTFDIVKAGVAHNYPDLLRRDVEKGLARKGTVAQGETEIFTLLLATHPHTPPSRRYASAVKYFGGVNKYATKNITVEQADQEIKRRLHGHPYAHHGVVTGGRAFEIDASVAYWLFGPYLK